MEEKNSKSKKSIIIIAIAVIVVIAIVAVVGSFVNENIQKQLISKEIDKINKTSEVDTDIKSKGKYADEIGRAHV